MGFREHRESVQHGVQCWDAGLALEAALDERIINRLRQLVDQRAVVGGSFHVIHQKLQDRRHRKGQGDRLAIAQPEPGRPITQRTCRN